MKNCNRFFARFSASSCMLELPSHGDKKLFSGDFDARTYERISFFFVAALLYCMLYSFFA